MSQNPLVGKTLRHHYRILQELGSGGFGDTYLAQDLDLPGQPYCVVKHLKPKSHDPAVLPIAKTLFEREAQTLYQLGNHSSQIPRLFAHFEENGEFYLVQEFIEGHDLTKEIIPGQLKLEKVIIKLLQDILEVLAVVHQHQVIHRDIKPQNLMRRKADGKIVLIDFGAVKEIGTLLINPQGQTSVSVAIGSPGYMPSEQAKGKPKYASDVYAVGIIAIQAVTGLMPNELEEDPDTGEIIWRNYAQVSDNLAEVLDKMVSDHFSQRYPTASAALAALMSINAPLLSSTPPPPLTPTLPPTGTVAAQPPTTLPTPPPSVAAEPAVIPVTLAKAPSNSTRRKFLTTISLGGVGLGGVLIWQAVKPKTDPPPSPGISPATDASPIATTTTGESLGRSPATEASPVSTPTTSTGGDTIKVGILHSLSGTMAISEKSAVDAEQLAIEEINAAGGVLGKQIEAIVEDGSSDWPTFAEKAKKLIDRDKVVTVFGCWTSASRKAVLPIFEQKKHMLWYPVQYEGQECSQNIFYAGAVPNQQIEPAVDWLLQNEGKEFFLVGSDYVFPRTANTIIKAQLQAKGGKTVGEDYISLGDTEVTPIIAKIKNALPNGGVIFNTFNGDSNIAFFKGMQEAGLGPDKYPIMSVIVTEEEVQAIGTDYLKGHYAAWSYFQTVDTPANKKFVEAFKQKYGGNRVINDPMEAAYIMVYLWKQAVEKAKTTELEAVRQAARGQTFDAPEGQVTLENNHHLSKFARIGRVGDDGLFEIVYETPSPVKPIPWNQFVAETKGFACDWSDPRKGGKYKV
jgi:urea transport system substrate-binding protein